MCGIVFNIQGSSEPIDKDEWDQLVTLNAQRGPHAQKTIILDHGLNAMHFFSSVLHLRGDHVAVQPHQREGDVLCWNGEIFEGLDISSTQNDGVKLFDRLCGPNASVPEILSTLEGPYAFVFYQHATRTVYFGRDPLGRRSLLIRKPLEGKPSVTIASVSTGNPEFEELPADSLFSISWSDANSNDSVSIQPVMRAPLGIHSHLTSPTRLLRQIPESTTPIPEDPLPAEWIETVTEYIKHLEASVSLRVRDIPRHATHDSNSARVAVLFSGGVDSAVVAFLAHRHLPPDEQIDLLNVAFENPRSLQGNLQPSNRRGLKQRMEAVVVSEDQKYLVPDRVTGLAQVEEFRRLAPQRIWNFVEINVPYEESARYRATIEQLMAPAKTVMDLVRLRSLDPVLFTPGESSIDDSVQSLAQALFFASRGVGTVRKQSTEQSYTSIARVMLSGLGADELLGGYIRHKNAFKHAGWQGLLDELQMDVDRIHTRNLGRDDRIISSHGKEARYPFLSMTLLSYLSSIPVHLKVDPRVIGRDSNNEETDLHSKEHLLVLRGLPGDKLLHRLAARKLGLWSAAGRAKRAMQFGSRSARMEGGELGKKSRSGTDPA